MVLVWSDTAAKSFDVLEEIRIARVFLKPIFPILATYPMDRIPPLPKVIRNLQVIDEGNIDSSVTELTARLSDPRRNTIRYLELRRKGFIPQTLNPYFVGRNRELKNLFVDTMGFHGETRIGIPIAIWGLAGIGKTHLALTFGYRFNLFFSGGVYWVDTPKGIVQEFGKIGNHLGIRKLRDERPVDYAKRVYENFCRLNKALVIFDDVSNFDEFKRRCPVGINCCSVILTTRKLPRGFPVRVMDLPELDAESARHLISSRRRDRANILANQKQNQALKRICEIMGNHPFALEQCATYLQRPLVQPSNFLQDLEKGNPLTHLKDFQIFRDQGAANLLDVLTRNYNSLDRESIDRYFLLMCWFAPHGINIDLIINAYSKADEGRDALGELAENSLIYLETKDKDKDKDKDIVSLHPLVSQFGRALSKTQSADYRKRFVELIVDFLQKNKDNLSSEQVHTELPHIYEAIEVSQTHGLWEQSARLHEYCAEIETDADKRIELLEKACQIIIKENLHNEKIKLPSFYVRLGKAYRTKAQFKDALANFEAARKLYKDFPKVDAGELASLQFEAGDAYLALGQYDRARELLSGALTNLASYDQITPEVTRTKQALARIDLFLGNYDAAEKSFVEVLEVRNQFHANFPGVESSLAVSSSYEDLSWLALERGNHEQARIEVENAFAAIKEHHKEDDPVYNSLLLLLGRIHSELGNFTLAEEQIEKAKNIFSSTFGENHPSYARALVALCEVNRRQGKFTKTVQEQIEKAVEIFENRYGMEHPAVAEALEVQGKLYDHLCEFEKEKLVWERVLSIQNEAFSVNPNHPALATTYQDYGNFWLRQGDFKQALVHFQKSIAITVKSLGKSHPQYFGRLVLLAACLYEQQEYSAAQKTLTQAKRLENKIFKKSHHPFVARMYQLQSEVFRRLGKFKAALTSIDKAISIKTAIYGASHPSVAEAYEVQVKVYHHLGKTTEALTLIEATLKIRQDSYGKSHPAVGRSEHDLGSYYLRLGKYKEAIDHFEAAIKITKSIFGQNHPEYVERSLHLANAQYEKGEYGKALKLLNGLEKIMAEAGIGANHYLRARWLQSKSESLRRQGQFEDALDSINKAIEMKETIYGKVHPSVAEALDIKGKILDHLCRFEDEENVWERALEIQSKVYPANHPALATTHYDCASLYLRKSEFDQAQEHSQKSLRITKASLGTKHPEYYGRLIRLATCQYEQQEYSEANDTLKQARSLKKDIFGESLHPYIARMHQLQSEVHRRLGNFKAALTSINEAIRIKKELYGNSHPSVAEALEVKVKVFHHQGETKQSKQHIERALKIRIDSYGEKHPEVGRSEHDLGSYFLRIGQYDEAISHFNAAINITKKTFGEYHPEYIERTLHLANAYYEKGEYTTSLNLVKDLENVIKVTITAENHYLKARWLFGMAENHRRLGLFKEALDYIDQAIDMRIAIYSEKHPSVAEVLECKGKIYDHLCEFGKEEAVWEQILDIQSEYYPEEHPAAATTHYHYGNLCLRRGEFSEALKHLEKSLSITEKSKNQSHYFGRLVLLATCQYEQQNYTKAQEILKAAQALQKIIFGKTSHPYIARMFQVQSQIERRLGELEKALTSIDQAIAMKKKIYAKEDHPSVAEALEVNVDLHLAQFQTEETEELLSRIERIRKAAYGEEHPEYANYQMRVAEYHAIKGEYTEAQKFLEASLKTCSRIFGSGHPETIRRQVMSARLARLTSDINEANKKINAALDALGARVKNEISFLVASVLLEAALVRRKQSDYKGALEKLEKAIRIAVSLFGKNSQSVLEMMVHKVKHQLVMHQFPEAQLAIENAIKSIKQHWSIANRLRADFLNQKGILLTHQGKSNEAIKCFDEAIQYMEKLPGQGYGDLSKLYLDKAVALRICGQYPEALTNVKNALNIDNLRFNGNHVFFARISLENGKIYYCQKNYEAAEEQLKDALDIYEDQSQLELRDHAMALLAQGLVNIAPGFDTAASKSLTKARSILNNIFDEEHPSRAEFKKVPTDINDIRQKRIEIIGTLEKIVLTC